MTSELYKGYLKHERCIGDGEDFWMTAKPIYIQQRSVLFRIITFEYWYIPIFEWVHISRRVAWAVSEVLCICIAMNISMKFRQYCDRLQGYRHQIVWSSYWTELREHYVMLCLLIDKANEFVSPLIVIITFADFFFLCERLFKQYA